MGRFLSAFQFSGSCFMCVICHECAGKGQKKGLVKDGRETWQSLDGTTSTSESSRGPVGASAVHFTGFCCKGFSPACKA